MKNLISIQFLVFALIITSSTCKHANPGSSNSIATSPSQIAAPPPRPTPNQLIRLVDFNNVAYPHYPEYTVRKKRYVTLKPGEGGPANLDYGDVTGDGIEEALMMLGIESRGSAIPEIVYVFGLKDEKPILLWSFETGDRADGGLRQVYADHGDLVVELFGKDRIIGKDLYLGDEPLSDPKAFTRARYEWSGGKFRLKGDPEVLPNSSGDASSIMPPYFGPAGH